MDDPTITIRFASPDDLPKLLQIGWRRSSAPFRPILFSRWCSSVNASLLNLTRLSGRVSLFLMLMILQR